MFSNTISIKSWLDFPQITKKCDLAEVIIQFCEKKWDSLKDGDILCIASKIVSKSRRLFVNLGAIQPSELALKIHHKVSRKDPRIIQLIINQTGDLAGKRLQISHNFIGGWLPNGLFLTSAGVDKVDENTAIVLPKDCDEIAEQIAEKLYEKTGKRVAIVITDSDGRIDKKGATQVAVGLYGINGLRKTQSNGKINIETICDMLAASAGLLMGQRDNMVPIVTIRGFEYEFDRDATVEDTVA
ncbi:coenzyme F420-0:L-glutamate ligase [Lactobacillus helveticus]|uniref:Coenzyme F420:L-glutamate ligase n=2 Tax=Lactobacillus helveticus TaxID=1587 RepID=A0A9Q5C1T2_LACHE|nr:coenzyme F420-0:L-glutamate ligase [Lactobacillus helveticus]ADX70281.1 F420-0--gamma-glutamyl ligase [Lactobacillus helveticus H10]KXN77789.1 glutamate ligase [Lactobacillus helveticus]MCT3425260.1 glutamate ligase [Lactobacillus helveticus]NRN79636.1 Coenzyme F420:L-glutamate ligase [Lactobacillus helveticus]NRN83838.1 Coenzyme F420:L-glutamate ligase [Lactobacillus helveticus]